MKKLHYENINENTIKIKVDISIVYRNYFLLIQIWVYNLCYGDLVVVGNEEMTENKKKKNIRKKLEIPEKFIVWARTTRMIKLYVSK